MATETLADGRVKSTFIKRVTVDGKTSDYPAYLIFASGTDGWKIAAESDSVTDKELIYRLDTDVPEGVKKGDYNGDGITEDIGLVLPKVNEEEMDCGEGDCTAYIRFSDKSIPEIKVTQCIGGQPVNLGDLNDDGTDEVGLLPQWFTSCWTPFYIWTLKGGKWVEAVKPISTHCNQWEEGVVPIEKAPGRKGFVIIRYSEMVDVDIVTKEKIVRIR